MGRMRFRLSFIISRALLAGLRRAYRSRLSGTSSLRASGMKGGAEEAASFIVSTSVSSLKQKKKQKKQRGVGFRYICCREDPVVLPMHAVTDENSWGSPQQEACSNNVSTSETKSVTGFVEESGDVLEGRRAPVNSDVSGLLVAPAKERKRNKKSRSSSSSRALCSGSSSFCVSSSSNSRVLCSGSSSFCVSSSSTSSGGELDDEPLFASDTGSSRLHWERRSEQLSTDVDGRSVCSRSSSSSSGKSHRNRHEPRKQPNRLPKPYSLESRTKKWGEADASASSSIRSIRSSSSTRKRSSSKRRMRLGCGASPQIMNNNVKGGVPVMMLSSDPYEDFRQSMIHMISERGVTRIAELEELLDCYLRLNSPAFHGLILQAFSDIVRAAGA